MRVGMEATGYSRWFERLLAELGIELWIGNPAEIKAKRVKKQKTDRNDARLLLRLMREGNFPADLGTEPGEPRFTATAVASASAGADAHAVILESVAGVGHDEGYRWKRKSCSANRGEGCSGRKARVSSLAESAPARLLELLDRLNPTIEALTAAVEQEAKKQPEVLRLMTHPGVGPLTALAFVLIIGTPDRFPCGKQIGSYVGLIPSEDSSAGRQRLGHISKQGNSLLRFLLVEAAQAAVRYDPDWRRRYVHLAMRRERRIAKVAMARRLAVRLYWMWRNGWEYSQWVEFGSNAGQLVTGHGVN